MRDCLSNRSSLSVIPAEAGRSAKRGERPKDGPEGASKASRPVSSVSGCRVLARLSLTQRAFRRPAGDVKLVPWDRRVTFLLLAQKKSNPKKMAVRTRARSDMRDRA